MFEARFVYIIVLWAVLCVVDAQNPFLNMVNGFFNLGADQTEGLVDDAVTFDEEYDFIVVGAGSAGCVVTNRLTENTNWSILLLEAGRDEIFLTDVPLSASLLSITDYNWGYHTEKSNTSCLGLQNGRCKWARGKAMGGTSTINLMIYARGNKRDYDDWEKLGNPGWSYKDVLPYFKKSERAVGMKDTDKGYHGLDGYLNVEHSPYRTPLVRSFLEASSDFGYKIRDPNGQRQLGFSVVQANMRNGRRCSASKAFIRPIRNRPNLHVAKEARVTKILINPTTKQAYGVEFIKNQQRYRIRVKKEVILSAGSINTPQLLMLSGIGPKDHLEKHNIKVIQDLKVGYNLQDHLSLAALTFMVNDSVTLSDQRVQNIPAMYNYIFNRRGPYTVPGGAEALAFVKTNRSMASDDDYPDIELVLGAGGLNGDSSGSIRSLIGIPQVFYEEMYGDVQGVSSFSITPVLMRPRSLGRVMLKDDDPFRWPLMYGNYFEDERDVDTLVEGVKMAISIAESRSFRHLNARLLPRPFPGCRHLKFRSDDYWRCSVRHYTSSLFHQVGTCRMGSDPEAVVDPRLRVLGVKGLRVVDASIIPQVMAGHPHAAVVMIGEKASDMIKEDWR